MSDNFFRVHKGVGLAAQTTAPANPVDGDVYYDSSVPAFRFRENGTWKLLGSGAATGDVVGPASATDNALARFDTTTGKLVQNSVVSLGDTGAMTGLTALTTGDLTATQKVKYTITGDAATGANATLTAPPSKIIRLTSGTLTSIDMIPAGQDGQEIILINSTGATVTVNNNTGATTANRIFTGTGANISLANQASIPLVYSTTDARWMVAAGVSSGGGSSTLATLTDVTVSSLADGQVLQYNSTTGKWINTKPVSGAEADIMYASGAESETLTEFTQTNAEIVTTNFLHGTKSFRLQPAGGTTVRDIKKTIAVDKIFRGKQMTFSLNVLSTLPMANLVVLFRDETAGLDIGVSQQIQTDSMTITADSTFGSTTLSNIPQAMIALLKVGMLIGGTTTGTSSFATNTIAAINTTNLSVTLAGASGQTATGGTFVVSGLPAKRTFSVTIPETCSSFSYKISATNDPTRILAPAYFDDIVLQLASRALSSAAITTQTTESQSSQIVQTANFTNVTITGATTASNGSGIYSYDSATGIYTALKTARVNVTASLNSSTTGSVEPEIVKGSTRESISTSIAVGNGRTTASANFEVVTGDTWKINNNSATTSNQQWITVLATATGSVTQTIPLTSSIIQVNSDSMVRLNTGNTYGTTYPLVIRRFANISSVIGSDIQYVDSVTLGASFTALVSGEYFISYTDLTGGINETIGLSLNTTQPTTGINLLSNVTEILAMQTSVSANTPTTAVWQGYLNAGDVVRPHNNVSASANNTKTQFTMSRVGSSKIINPSSDQKIEVATHELRFDGASTRGSTATSVIKFDTQTSTRGDGFSVVSTAALGTAITILKDGVLTFNAVVTLNGATLWVTKNQAVLTTDPTGPETVAIVTLPAGSSRYSTTNSISVKAGDVIRAVSNLTPTADTYTRFSLYLQEQKVAVALQNVTPTFVDAGSNVHVAQANGKGSTNTPIRRFANVIQNIGADVTYTDSVALGGSFLINTSDFYMITFSDQSTGSANMMFGVSKNTTQPTTDFNSLSDSSGLVHTEIPNLDDYGCGAWTGYLTKGDVLRLHGTAAAMVSTNAGNARTHFSIVRIGKPSLTSVDVTPFVNSKITDTEVLRYLGASSGLLDLASEVRFPVGGVSTTNLGVIQALDDSTNTRTKFVALKKCYVDIHWSGRPAASNGYVIIFKNGDTANGYAFGNQNAANSYTTVAASMSLEAGEYFTVGSNANLASESTPVSLAVKAVADNGATATTTQQVSSDTLNFSFKSTAITSSDPIGTINTYTYAASGNVATIATTAPTQSLASMNTDGVRVFGRAYNASSTAASPARVDIFIGTGLKNVNTNLYMSSGKTSQGFYDQIFTTTTSHVGTNVLYDEKTGILTIDAGFTPSASVTLRYVGEGVVAAGAGGPDGYFVFNASKIPSLVTIPNLTPRIASLRDEKASGTAGGTATSGAFSTRTLNTLDDPTGLVTSLTSNQFTLAAGTYYLEAQAPAYGVNNHQTKIRNITDSTDALIGTGSSVGSGNVIPVGNSFVSGTVTIASAKVFELQHRVSGSFATAGLGQAMSFGVNEVFAQVKITKIK